jgi:hypothetical protein
MNRFSYRKVGLSAEKAGRLARLFASLSHVTRSNVPEGNISGNLSIVITCQFMHPQDSNKDSAI